MQKMGGLLWAHNALLWLLSLSKSLFYPDLIIRPGDVGQPAYSETPTPEMEGRYDSENFRYHAAAKLYAVGVI